MSHKVITSKICKRVTPEEWSNYAAANLVMKFSKVEEPVFILNGLNDTLYTTSRKLLIGKYFNNAKVEIVKQSTENRLVMMDEIGIAWFGMNWTVKQLKTHLKKTF